MNDHTDDFREDMARYQRAFRHSRYTPEELDAAIRAVRQRNRLYYAVAVLVAALATTLYILATR